MKQAQDSTYNYARSFEDNATRPPTPSEEHHDRPLPQWQLLGHEVGYPLGVAASALTANSAWIRYFASQGFNVITYKTVRSCPWQAHPAPNWIFLDNLTRPLPVDKDLHDVIARGSHTSYPTDMAAYSMANSFGIPSRRPQNWQADVAKTLEILRAGQILIVSVVGSKQGKDLVADFAKVARLAEDAGATAIELNLSCPNTLGGSGGDMRPPISESAKATLEIVEAVRQNLQESRTKVIAKLGYMPRPQLAEVVGQIADSVDGVSGINSIQASVVNAAGTPVFQGRADDDQAPRRLAGISGIAIRDLALDFVSNLAELRRDHGWTFDIIGIGGVMNGHDVRALMAAGADAVQAATAAANNPSLPKEVGCSFPEGSKDLLDELYRRVADTSWRYRTAEGLSRELGMDPSVVEKVLESHPEMIRKSALKDRYGRATWTMSSQPRSRQEKLAKLRRLLARQ